MTANTKWDDPSHATITSPTAGLHAGYEVVNQTLRFVGRPVQATNCANTNDHEKDMNKKVCTLGIWGGPLWSGDKVSNPELERSRFEIQFRQRSAMHVGLAHIKADVEGQTPSNPPATSQNTTKIEEGFQA
ncbi:hypothetical protein AVEN_38290-1 [Araneus ventricosus]|uniref:Uncharacterized protein n=1 Tax=Araneus ventricosus TaxID=182803 RepID=A0A4Y2E8B6_ARAVE|nr:hypothetical protein AVEN_38290-1 [Araneus ventricosus]